MSETPEKKEEGSQPQEKPENSNGGPEPGTKEKSGDESPIETAKRLNKENTKLLEDMKEERKRIEKATSESLVNGRSQAGQIPKQKTEDEKWAEGAKERYAGTGLDPTPDNNPTTFA